MPTRKKIRLLATRVFASVILLVWLGNDLPPIMATITAPDDSCQMSCCKGFKHLSRGSSGKMCPMMAKGMAMRDAEESPPAEINAPKNENIFGRYTIHRNFDFGVKEKINSHDNNSSHNNNSPFLQIKTTKCCCDQTACGASGSSSSGHRQPQSSDNCALLSRADRARPPTITSLVFKTRVSFNLVQQILYDQISSRGPPAFFL